VSAIAIGGALVLVMVGLDRIANMVVRPTPRPPDRTIEDVRGLAYADFDVPAGDRELAAWTLHPRTTPRRPVFLIAHDWKVSYGTILRLIEPLARACFEVVLFDIRGHGRNEEVPYVTVRHFRDDITAAVRHMRVRHPGRPVVLVGHSLGGAGAVLSVAEGAPVDGLVLIATPADVLAVTAEFLSDHGLPGRLIVNVCRPFFWRRVGGSPSAGAPRRRYGIGARLK